MIMRVRDVDAASLQEWHDILFEKREQNLYNRHTNPLTLTVYHQLIRDLAEECETWTEFGIYQGHSLSAALLTKPKKVRGYDVSLDNYAESSHLFEKFAQENDIDFEIITDDTATCPVIDETDVLHIDSLHTYEHCKKELARHGNRVRKFILFHDTTYAPKVYNAINEFIGRDWKVVTRSTVGVGYTLIKRKTRDLKLGPEKLGKFI